MAGFFRKTFQAPAKLVGDATTNVAEKVTPSILTSTKDYVTGHVPKLPIPDISKLPIPDVSKLPIPSLSNLPIPDLSKLPIISKISLPDISKIPMQIISKIPMPDLSNLPMPHIPGLSAILQPVFGLISSISGGILSAIFGLISSISGNILSAIIGLISSISGSILAKLFGLFSSLPDSLLAIATLVTSPITGIPWFFLFNDRNICLAFWEYIGSGVKRKYKGKVVWIVGASSSVGQAMALELASVGAKIILSARRKDVLKKLKMDCIEKSKGKCFNDNILVLPYDVTKMDEECVQNVIRHFGKIDVFIINIDHMELGEACEMDINVDRELFEINFFGPIFITKRVVKHFMETGGGQIIVVSSLSGKFGVPGQASTSACKRALHGYFESVRTECARHKIYVTTVCPGLICSPAKDHSVARSSKISQEEVSKMTRKGVKTKRCAHLILVAGANRCRECWISNQPFLFLTYVAQYYPWFHKFIMGYILSKKRLEKIYEGKLPNMWMWRPLFVI